MDKPQVLILGIIEQAHEEINDLKEVAHIIEPKATNRKDFISECKSGAFDRVTAIYRTFDSLSTTGRFDDELLHFLPQNIKFVSHCGAGYDQVDVDACTKRGIQVSHVPIAVNDSTADTAMFLILGTLRGFNPLMNTLRAGKWRGTPDLPLAHDPQGKVLGILGLGRIGRNLMKKAAAFGMIAQYHNRNKLAEDLSDGAKYVGFEELLATSDVLYVSIPLTEQSRHLISHAQLATMKKGAILINTARGAVIDEEALVQALDSGHIASCGLDVFEKEPEIHEGLLRNENIILLPHLGTYTVETIHKMEECNLGNVRMAITEGKLVTPVIEQRDVKF